MDRHERRDRLAHWVARRLPRRVRYWSLSVSNARASVLNPQMESPMSLLACMRAEEGKPLLEPTPDMGSLGEDAARLMGQDEGDRR